MNDTDLLQAYLDDRSERAFTELVELHLPLVYRTALRGVNGDEHLAHDVAQRVFALLARKAASLRGHASLAGWLYTTTRTTAAQAVRTEVRRRQREEAASTMNEPAPLRWEQLAPVIDEALAQLKDDDRTVVLLRFFEGKRLEEMGALLGVSADAARMRVERALQRLEIQLGRVGITSTASAVALALEQQATWAAPAGMAAELARGALAGLGAQTATFVLMTTGKLKLIVAGVVIAGGAATLAVQHYHPTAPSGDAMPSSSPAPIASVPPTVEAAAARPTTSPVPHTASTPSASGTVPAATAAEPSTGAEALIPIDRLGNRGFATPRDALATQLWAAHGGDVALETKAILIGPKAKAAYDAVVENVPAEIRAQYPTPEALVAYALSGSPRPVSGMQVLAETELGPDDVVLKMSWQHEGSTELITNDARFHREEDGWKLVVPPTLVTRALTYLARAGATPTK